MGELVHANIASRWENILKQGLDGDTRSNLLGKYPPIGNCPLVEAPKLNLEVKASINELVLRRDARLGAIQNQIGASLGAIGKALTILVGQEKEGVAGNIRLIELLSDAGRLLADVHQSETEARRALVASNLNKKVKDTLINTSRDEWLFGKNLSDRVKDAKALEKSSSDFKTEVQKRKYVGTNSGRGSLNSKRPSRQSPNNYRQGGRKHQPQKRSNQSTYNRKPQYNVERRRRI